MKSIQRFIPTVVWLAGTALGVYVIVSVFRGSETDRIFQILLEARYWSLLILLPFVIVVYLDSVAWQILFVNMGKPLPLSALTLTRTAAEAIALTLPAGVAVAESTKPLMLHRTSSLDIPSGIAGVFLKKCFVALSQGTYVLIGLCMGFIFLSHSQRLLLPGGSLIQLLAAIGVGLILVGILGVMLCLAPRESSFVNGILHVLPFASWRAKIGEIGDKMQGAFHRFRHIRSGEVVRVLALLTVAWLFESVESFILLRALSVECTIFQVLPMEVSVSLLRGFMFFVPAGVGVQEFGYASFLTAAGVPDPVHSAAAFAFLKRAKEIVVIVVGYILIARFLRKKTETESPELTPGGL
jgi:uncharacterized membrane protein YbhN (UPF0104 family)